ncbi:MAG: iron chelate uptake ABC transporter family permease subunit [Pseudomonadota bacterium]
MTAKKTYFLWALFASGLAALIVASLLIGAASLTSTSIADGVVLMVSRIPRTIAALLAGAGLAVAGVVIQQAVQNRLVEPGLTGTSEAAMLGLLLITLISPATALILKMFVGAGAALIGTLLFFLLARYLPKIDPLLLPLVGLIYSGILGAAAIWVAWNTELMQFLGVWAFGDFSGVLRGRYELLWLIAALVVLLYFIADRITVLGLGEDYARSLGLNYGQTLSLGLIFVALTVSVVVVTVGALPFVGLVVPNIISRLLGDNLRQNLPVIALTGSAFVLGSDVLGRLVRHPYEIPAATIFSILGAIIFLWLLYKPVKQSHQHG